MQCSKAILMKSNLNTNMWIEEQVGQRCHQVTKWHGCQWTEWSKQLSLPGLAVLQYIYIYIRLSFTGGVINLELELRLWNSFFACLNLGIFNWPRRNSKLVQGFLGRLNNKNLLLRFLRMQRSSNFKMCLSFAITLEGQAWARGPKICLHEDRFSKKNAESCNNNFVGSFSRLHLIFLYNYKWPMSVHLNQESNWAQILKTATTLTWTRAGLWATLSNFSQLCHQKSKWLNYFNHADLEYKIAIEPSCITQLFLRVWTVTFLSGWHWCSWYEARKVCSLL